MSMPDPTPKSLVETKDSTVGDTSVEDATAELNSQRWNLPLSLSRQVSNVLDMGGKWTIKFAGLGSSLGWS